MSYIRQWRDAKLAEARASLGGCCTVCGSTEGLEFDHVDTATKVREVTTILYTRNLDEFWAEVAKCQLLCKDHHAERSASQRALPAHGSQRRHKPPYRCRCDVCVAAAKARNKTRWVTRPVA